MPTYAYQHFTVEQLADRVYAAIAADEGGLLCNAAIVDLGETTLVFDTGATLPAARELRAAAETLTGHPATYAINSHVHPDHIHGNGVFAPAITIASHVTRAAIASEGPGRLERFGQQLNGRLDGYPSLADLKVPALSFAGEMTFHGTSLTARLIACGPAHTACDAVLWLPESGVLFAGDLITDGNLIMTDGNPEAWLQVLDRLAQLGPRLVVPGHGEVAAADAAIAQGTAYIEGLLGQVAEAFAADPTADWETRLPVPDGCGEYWFRRNVRFLVERHRRAEA